MQRGQKREEERHQRGHVYRNRIEEHLESNKSRQERIHLGTAEGDILVGKRS